MHTLDRDFWTAAVDALAASFEESEGRLCGYDGAVGDGDHGTSMLLGFRQGQASLRETPAADTGELIRRVGEAFIDTVGGVTGVVFGSVFTAAGQAAAGLAATDAAAIHRLFAAGLAAAKNRGKVSEGDKTMVDALAPAVEALRAAAEAGQGAAAALARAARAAEAGMNATIPMEARVGRARYQAGKGAGHVDAGAASMCLVFQVLSAAAGA
jgi:phosphoenolpyruvate---glycerone phosphotransferase subunit DhaL